MDLYKTNGKFLSLAKTNSCNQIERIKNLIDSKMITPCEIMVLISGNEHTIRLFPKNDIEIYNKDRWIYDGGDSLKLTNKKTYNITLYVRKASQEDVSKLFWILMDFQRLSMKDLDPIKSMIEFANQTNWFTSEKEFMTNLKSVDVLSIYLVKQPYVENYVKVQIDTSPWCDMDSKFRLYATNTKYSMYIYAMIGNRVLGFIVFWDIDFKKGLHVELMCTDPTYKDKFKIGTSLMKEIEQYGDDNGYHHIKLKSMKSSKGFYQKVGFIEMSKVEEVGEILHVMDKPVNGGTLHAWLANDLLKNNDF